MSLDDYKVALLVVKENKVTLFLLQGRTVITAAAVASLEYSDSDATRLWHMGSWHISERVMMVLSKYGLLCNQK